MATKPGRRRHRRVLRQLEDAEDAFQATFIVLARQARALVKNECVGGWLHRVAHRLALDARRALERRSRHERQSTVMNPTNPEWEAAWREVQVLLDDEIQRLPERYRDPFILCALGGQSCAATAQRLGLKEGTVWSRLAEARKRLQARLSRRGVELTTVLGAAALAPGVATAQVGPALVAKAVSAATGASVPASVSLLVKGAAASLAIKKAKVGVALFVVFSGLVGTASMWAVRSEPGGEHKAPPAEPAQSQAAAVKAESPIANDQYGDPLPPGAVARLGTLRQRAPDSQLALSADGKEIIAVDSAFLVRRFDAETGKLIGTSQIPGETGWSYRLSPKGTYVVKLGFAQPPRDFQLELWDVAQRKRLKTLSLGESGIGQANEIAFAPDESFLAFAASPQRSGPKELQVAIWDLKTFQSSKLWSKIYETNAWYQDEFVAISADGKRIAASHHDRIIRCWDKEEGKLLWESKDRNLGGMFFSPDSKTLIARGMQRWDADTGNKINDKSQSPEEFMMSPIGFTPDGRFIVCDDGSARLVLWDPIAAKVAMRLPATLARPDDGRKTIIRALPHNFVFTRDGKGIIRSAGALQRLELATGKPFYAMSEKWGHTEGINRVLFSPDGKLLASVAKDDTVRLWEVATRKPIQVMASWRTSQLAFNRDGSRLFSTSVATPEKARAVLREWEVTSGKPVRDYEALPIEKSDTGTSSGDKEVRVAADGSKILALTFKNGRRDNESILTTWDAVTGKCLVRKRVPWAEDSIITADGESVLAFDGQSETLKLLDINTGGERLQFQTDRIQDPRQKPYDCHLALSASGRLMCAQAILTNLGTRAKSSDAIRVGDMSSGRQIMKLPMTTPALFAFSPDDRFLTVAAPDGIKFWEIASGEQVGAIELRSGRDPKPGAISSLDFSPDGLTLATGHADSTILLWDTALQSGIRGGKLTEGETKGLWDTLAGSDARRAYAAIGRFVDDPQRAVTFLKDHLRPVAAPPADVIGRLLNDLGSNDFKVRKAAEEELRALGRSAEAAMRQGLSANPDLEKHQRLKALLSAAEASVPNAQELRRLRAIMALERIGSPEAQTVLEIVACGAPGARETEDAKTSLERLSQRTYKVR
jgi:RNA polymerase sigma factor (sigma-70 family)